MSDEFGSNAALLQRYEDACAALGVYQAETAKARAVVEELRKVVHSRLYGDNGPKSFSLGTQQAKAFDRAFDEIIDGRAATRKPGRPKKVIEDNLLDEAPEGAIFEVDNDPDENGEMKSDDGSLFDDPDEDDEDDDPIDEEEDGDLEDRLDASLKRGDAEDRRDKIAKRVHRSLSEHESVILGELDKVGGRATAEHLAEVAGLSLGYGKNIIKALVARGVVSVNDGLVEKTK